MKITIAGQTINLYQAPAMVIALRSARDYMSCIPEAAAGGDNEAHKLVKLIDAVLALAVEAQPPGSQPPGATSRPDTRNPAEPGNRIIPGFEG